MLNKKFLGKKFEKNRKNFKQDMNQKQYKSS